MTRVGGLGRGLSALIDDATHEEVSESSGRMGQGGARLLPVDALEPHPDQPRRAFADAALDELAASIRERGLLQPIVVRARGSGYQIVAGERRWRAAQRARLTEVPVIVRDFDDSETLQVAILENIQREDLNAIEEAEAYRRLMLEFGHTQDALAKVVHKSRSHVANLLRLLDLPGSVQVQVVAGTLTMGHARALLGAPEVESLAEQVVARGLSVRDTEKLARAAKGGGEPARARGERSPRESGGRDSDVAALEQQLADLLGVSVRIAFGEGGGSITLAYQTLDQLDMLCQRLSGEAM